jgi:hypothetical protein
VFPWYSAAMLALEANHVIVLRLSKMAFGGPVAHSEAYDYRKNRCGRTSRRLLLVIVNTCRQMQIVSL